MAFHSLIGCILFQAGLGAHFAIVGFKRIVDTHSTAPPQAAGVAMCQLSAMSQSFQGGGSKAMGSAGLCHSNSAPSLPGARKSIGSPLKARFAPRRAVPRQMRAHSGKGDWGWDSIEHWVCSYAIAVAPGMF